MARQSEALKRIIRFNNTPGLPEQDKNLGVRFTLPQLKQLVSQLENVYTNSEGHAEEKFDVFDRPTGVVFMVGRQAANDKMTMEVIPVVGQTTVVKRREVHSFDFIIQNNVYGFTNFNGGGGGNQRTPPPSATI